MPTYNVSILFAAPEAEALPENMTIEAATMLDAAKAAYMNLYGGDLARVNPNDTTAMIVVFDATTHLGGDVVLGFRDPDQRSLETLEPLAWGGNMTVPGY